MIRVMISSRSSKQSRNILNHSIRDEYHGLGTFGILLMSEGK
jgi:hypothetical protein